MQNLMSNLSTILTVILACIELLTHLYHLRSTSQQTDKRMKKYSTLGSNISKKQDNNLIKNYILENIFILIICV
ncbi:hypothetical protein, partial [Streptococcus suis]